MQKIADCPVEIAMNSEGHILVAYKDSVLDGAERLHFDPANGQLRATVRNRQAEGQTLFLGKVGPKFREKLASSNEILLVRSGEGKVYGGTITLEVTSARPN